MFIYTQYATPGMSSQKYMYTDDAGNELDTCEFEERGEAHEWMEQACQDDARNECEQESGSVILRYQLYVWTEDDVWDNVPGGFYEYQADPEEPECNPAADHDGHDWRNPDPEWGGRQASSPPNTAEVVYVRECKYCQTRRIERHPVSLPDGTITTMIKYESIENDEG